jgi:hypothetical protein
MRTYGCQTTRRCRSRDLVGAAAFTSQASRAYEIAGDFRNRRVPVVMGGIRATMCPDEATARVDAIVTGEADRRAARRPEPCWRGPRSNAFRRASAGRSRERGQAAQQDGRDLLISAL